MTFWSVLLVVAAAGAGEACGAAATTSAPAACHSPLWAIVRARDIPERGYLLGTDLRQAATETAYDPGRREWRVAFLAAGRRFLEVTVDEGTGTVRQVQFFTPAGPSVTPAEALHAVRADPEIDEYLRHHPQADLVPHFVVPPGMWVIRVLDGGRQVGVAEVRGGPAPAGDPRPAGGPVLSNGPWSVARGGGLRQVWQSVRPAFDERQVLYVCAALFLLVTLNLGRLGTLRTADVVALVLLVPAGLLVEPIPVAGYGGLWVLTGYFFVRSLARARGGWGRTEAEAVAEWGLGRSASAGGLTAAVVVVVLLQAIPVVSGASDTGGADLAGLVGGEQAFDRRVLPYGAMTPGFDRYGPLHYLLYGLAARAFPTGVDWRGYDLDHESPPADQTGARLLVFAFHLLSVVALVGIGKKHAGSVRLGLLLALAYLLLPQTVERVSHGSRLIPGSFIVLALWAWPNPWLSGACLTLAAAEWWFPMLLLPLYLTSFRGRGWLKFAAVVGLIGAVFLGAALVPPRGQTVADRWNTFLDATVYCEDGILGRSSEVLTDGVWRYLRAAHPAWGQVRRVGLLAYAAFCLALAAWPRRKTAGRMAALTAAVVVGTQLTKHLHGGRYVGWYAPVLLATLLIPLAPREPGRPDAA